MSDQNLSNSIDINSVEVFIFRHRAGWFIGQVYGNPATKTIHNPMNRNETMEVEPDYVIIDNAYEMMLKFTKDGSVGEYIFVPVHHGLIVGGEHKLHFDDIVFKSNEPHYGHIPTIDVKRDYLHKLLIEDTQEKKKNKK